MLYLFLLPSIHRAGMTPNGGGRQNTIDLPNNRACDVSSLFTIRYTHCTPQTNKPLSITKAAY